MLDPRTEAALKQLFDGRGLYEMLQLAGDRDGGKFSVHVALKFIQSAAKASLTHLKIVEHPPPSVFGQSLDPTMFIKFTTGRQRPSTSGTTSRSLSRRSRIVAYHLTRITPLVTPPDSIFRYVDRVSQIDPTRGFTKVLDICRGFP
ncbi:hypothetical protein QLX08_000653 [Tetragonisca angustula]|uniref:Uncharacterized protein n=1 Tax=Tetragonisca angustula TaxID=166442 RepID=A0AAW1AIU8_9HYME